MGVPVARPRPAPSHRHCRGDGLAVGAKRHGVSRYRRASGAWRLERRRRSYPTARSGRALLALKTTVPSLRNAREWMLPNSCMGVVSASPVAASQTRISFKAAVRARLPSRSNATARTVPRCNKRRADRRARGGVPESRGLVGAPGQQRLAVGAERHVKNRALMRERLTDRLAARGVPQPRRLVVRSRSARSCRRGCTGHRRMPTLEESGLGRSGLPVAASHNRAVLSEHPVRIVLPSGLYATAINTSPDGCDRLADRPAGRGVPYDGTPEGHRPSARYLPSGLNASSTICLGAALASRSGCPWRRPRAGRRCHRRTPPDRVAVGTEHHIGVAGPLMSRRYWCRSRGDWCRQAERLARAACASSGSPASTADRQPSTR